MNRFCRIAAALFFCAFICFTASASPSFLGRKLNHAVFTADSTGPIVSKVLTLVKGGYTITFTGEYFRKRVGQTVDVDVAMVDFTTMKTFGLKTLKDTLNAYWEVYKNPANFSIVTGKLTPTTTRTANLFTSCRFNLKIDDPRYTLVIVRNNKVNNCGATIPPPNFVNAGSSGCSCTACGGCCYREGPDNHCVYCN